MQKVVNQQVKKARELLQLSQDAVAEAINKPHTAISKMENGGQDVPTSLISFYRSKGISLDWLLLEKGEPFVEGVTPPVYHYSGRNNTATNSVNIGGQQSTESPEVLFLREQVKELKTELARCRETNEKLLEKILSK